MQTALQTTQDFPTAKECVDRCRDWLEPIIERERELIRSGLVRERDSRGEPDAIGGVAAQAKCPRTSLWSLLYRPPKTVPSHLYLALKHLYEVERARQNNLYARERAAAAAPTGFGRYFVRAADALVGEIDATGRGNA